MNDPVIHKLNCVHNFSGNDAKKVFKWYYNHMNRFSNIRACNRDGVFCCTVTTGYYDTKKELLADIERAANSPHYK